MEIQSLIAPIIDITRQAAEEILKIYNSDFTVTEKQDKTPVTEADIAANQIIVSGLNKLTPEIPILAEESTIFPYSERKNWTTYCPSFMPSCFCIS